MHQLIEMTIALDLTYISKHPVEVWGVAQYCLNTKSPTFLNVIPPPLKRQRNKDGILALVVLTAQD